MTNLGSKKKIWGIQTETVIFPSKLYYTKFSVEFRTFSKITKIQIYFLENLVFLTIHKPSPGHVF